MTINVVKDENEQLINYVAIFQDISNIKENEENLWHIAHHDPLTQMPNRSMMYVHLEQAMKQAIRDKKQLALLMIDLDGFKQVNDSLGHEAGDSVLQQVAAILSDNIRETDTASRYAGDEFILILKDLNDQNHAADLALTLIKAIQETIYYSEKRVNIGASVGITYYPQDANNSEMLISKADKAMYHSKNKGKNCFTIFSELD